MTWFVRSYSSKIIGVIFIITAVSRFTVSAQAKTDSAEIKYYTEVKTFTQPFVRTISKEYVQTYSLPERVFVHKIDSVRALLIGVLTKYALVLKSAFIKEQQIQINYYFDKLLADYPADHTGNTDRPLVPSVIPARLQKHVADLNDPSLLNEVMFRNYVHAYFAFELTGEVEKPVYRAADNRTLLAMINIIDKSITNVKCRNFWQYDYLYNYISNNGIKNIDKTYKAFKSTCTDTAYLNRVNTLYDYEYKQRQGHLIKTYKTIGTYDLQIHLFLPDTPSSKKRPVMVYFHPGDWKEGKPDWYFEECKQYARKGWVACAIEYRTYDREGATPYDAVKDARSAIRWLRKHATVYNIDTARIVANGYDAGGQLALACELANGYNEKTDDLHYKASPNLIMVTSGIYDLTDINNAWKRRELKDKALARSISPLFLVRAGMSPVLVIHGRKDNEADYAIAKQFEAQMKSNKNPIAFHPVDKATHLLWLDTKYAGEVERVQQDFLKKYGY